MSSAQPISRKESARLLHQAGLRRSQPRIILLQEISRIPAPVSHSEMVQRLAGYEFDAATIFRCLNDLADAGILARLLLGDRTWRFELRGGPKLNPAPGAQHPHFVCVSCGTIVCLHEDQAESAELVRATSAEVGEVTEILFKGTCRTCLQQGGMGTRNDHSGETIAVERVLD